MYPYGEQSNENFQHWGTVRQIAKKTGKPPQTIRKWAREGKVKARKNGQVWEIFFSSVQEQASKQALDIENIENSENNENNENSGGGEHSEKKPLPSVYEELQKLKQVAKGLNEEVQQMHQLQERQMTEAKERINLHRKIEELQSEKIHKLETQPLNTRQGEAVNVVHNELDHMRERITSLERQTRFLLLELANLAKKFEQFVVLMNNNKGNR